MSAWASTHLLSRPILVPRQNGKVMNAYHHAVAVVVIGFKARMSPNRETLIL
jgi:hypothetical protein